MDPKIRQEYDLALSLLVIEQGRLVSRTPDDYMWEDDDVYNDNPHLSQCRVVRHGTPVENEWREFVGTFAEPPYENHHGVDLPGVHCACGELVDRTIRLEMAAPEMAERMFQILYRRMGGEKGD